MEHVPLNQILERITEENMLKLLLEKFEENKHDMSIKKNIYIYGSSGIGKTTFVTKILQELNYDIIKYDASDIRNKSVIDNITHYNMSDRNIMSMFHNKVKKIVILMDEIDGMNNGDKGGINSLIKIIRPKKTKKQKLEEHNRNPIICIGNDQIDKKIKELMKVCNVIELKPPTNDQIYDIICRIMPTISNIDEHTKMVILSFIQNDLKKLVNIYEIYKNNPDILREKVFYNIFLQKSFNDNTKQLTSKLFSQSYSIDEHINMINDTDRTIIGLLWHENVINYLQKTPYHISIPFYLDVLKNVCFSDYIDRITYQKQIWQFNEMTSLNKTFYNNKLFHEYNKKNNIKLKSINEEDIRFTKVLTKYSTEYNNTIFIQNLCQILNMEQKDLYAFFFNLKDKCKEHDIYNLFEDHDITKLDINRIFRFLDKYTTENAVGVIETMINEDEAFCDESIDI